MIAQRYYSGVGRRGIARPEELVKICVITDTHFRYGVDGNPSSPYAGAIPNRVYYASNAKMRNFVDLVNEESPDFVMHNGDICDKPSDWIFFNKEWNEITQPKEVSVGNHDLDEMDIDGLAEAVGYENRPVNGGSAFNTSYIIEGLERYSIKIIVLDSSYDDSNNHTPDYVSQLSSMGLQYLKDEIENSTVQDIIIFSHNIPHYSSVSNYYPQTSALAAKGVIESALGNSPNIETIRWFGGHFHTRNLVVYNTLTERCLGYRMPDCIEAWDGNLSSVNGSTIIEVGKGGYLKINNKILKYPYTSL